MKIKSLVGIVLSEDEKDVTPSINAPEEPEGTPKQAPATNIKALILSIQKQSSDLYNMVGENDNIDSWVEDSLMVAAEHLKKAFDHVQYEKKKPVSVGDGETTPAEPEINEEAEESTPEKQKQIAAKDSWVRANKQAKAAKGPDKVAAKQRALSLKQTYLDAQKDALKKAGSKK